MAPIPNMKQSPLCRMCGVSMRTIPDGTGLCDDCKDEIKLQEQLNRAGKPRTPAMPSGAIGSFTNVVSSPHIPPGQVFITNMDGTRTLIGRTDEDIARHAATLTKLTGSALTADDLQRAMDGFGKLSEEKTKEVLELATQRRAEQVREVRQRVFTLLRPVVEEDMSDQELLSLTHALMAQMAPLGGTDIEGLYHSGVSNPDTGYAEG